MPNYYYLVDLAAPPIGRLQRLLDQTKRGGGRVLPHQIGHARVSIDGNWAIVQAEVSTTEHQAVLSDRATLLGSFDPVTGASQSVHDYLAANKTLWERPLP